MPRHFTQYWPNEQCNRHRELKQEGLPLDHTAGAKFTSRGIRTGDQVYVVTIYQGSLHLIGKLEVGQIVFSDEEAGNLIGYEPWSAPEHLIARRCTPMRFDNQISLDVVRSLLFKGTKGLTGLKFVSQDHLDPQTLRPIRQLTPGAARELDAFLDDLTEPNLPPPGLPDEEVKQLEVDFGDWEKNQQVEQAAVRHITARYEEEGWTVQSVETLGRGYDLSCTRGGQQQHVEVKSISGSDPAFFITENELRQAEKDSQFLLCAVTRVLSGRPQVHIWTGQELLERFEVFPLQYAARLRSE
jgi:hypothetical protein